MRIFETVSMHLESIGFQEKRHRFNKIQVQFCLKEILNISSIFMNLFFVANTPEEYMDGFFAISVAGLGFIAYLGTAFNTATIFVFINKFNKIINQSE